MVSQRIDDSPAPSEYVTARSRTASLESAASGGASVRRNIRLAPLSGDGAIGVSNNVKRQFKDRRIYVNRRTGLPVRPPTSFGLFKHALRRSIKGSKVDFLDFNRRAIEQWARMGEEDKEPYAQRAKELAEHYKKIEVRFLRKKLRQLQRQVKDRRGGSRQTSSSSSYYA